MSSLLLFLATAPVVEASINDNFGDGNDTSPAWSHFAPTAGATFDASSLSYAITVAATGNTLDPARALSLREDASFGDVVIAADLVDFDAVSSHSYGIVARSTSTLAVTHNGYALVVRAPGEIALLQIDDQVVTTLATASTALSVAVDYRLVLTITGSGPAQLTGKLFAASDLVHPIATLHYSDSTAPIYLTGFTGFLVADAGVLQDHALTATFDAFFASSPSTDTDGDGLSDGVELSIGTDPNDTDTDDDGLLDGQEIGTGVFGGQVVISTAAQGARAVFAADMDGDGDTDVLAASYADQTIAWYENDGTPLGSAWPEHPITTIADNPTSVFAADVDGDGDLDVLAASNVDYAISWYENDGTPAAGAWSEHPITPFDSGTVDFVDKVLAADMDGDGDMDVLASSVYVEAFAWYENDGTPAVGAWTRHVIGNGTVALVATDVDGDGDTDLINASPFDYIAWYENDGTPSVGLTWHEIAVNVGNPRRWVAAADFDGDGDVDVLSRSFDDYIAWYENDGTPAVGDWTAHPISTGPGSSISAFPADVDGDGDMDVLAALNFDNEVVWYENDGTPAVGAWTQHVISTAVSYPEWVVGADVDGDGDTDVISASFYDDKIAWYPQQNVADPLDPDTDNDGLSDGTEVNVYGTNPTLADTDGDAALDGSDNCPRTSNPTQSDVGGVLGAPPDGIGDACQCGDVDDSGIVDFADVDAYRDSLSDPVGLALTPAGVAKCSVIDSAGPCEILDVSVIRRALEVPPLLPGIAQVCGAAGGL